MAAKVETHLISIAEDRSISVADTVPIVAGSIGVDAVQIVFEEPADWQDLALVVYLRHSDGTSIRIDWDGESPIDVPWELTQNVGTITLSLIGSRGAGNDISQRGITQVASGLMSVVTPGITAGERSMEPTPDILDQIIEIGDNVSRAARAVIVDGSAASAKVDRDSGGTLGLIVDASSGGQSALFFSASGIQFAHRASSSGEWTVDWSLTPSNS